MMTTTRRVPLDEALAGGPGGGELAQVVLAIAGAAAQLSDVVGGPAAESISFGRHINASGDVQQPLDIRAHELFLASLSISPVFAVLSEEADVPIELNADAPYAVAIDPLDGSSNININAPVGTIFSILRAAPDADNTFRGDGNQIVAAGFVMYGPATTLVLSMGDGVDFYTLSRTIGLFERCATAVCIPEGTREFAINSSNYRHWDPWLRMYVDDLVAGTDGPRGLDFNMRWTAALVAEAFRIMVRGGIFLYPSDSRPGYRQGRLRLLYEAHPIAFLIEQAGGAATDGDQRLLDVVATSVHQRTSLMFGSADKVSALNNYRRAEQFSGERSPLFGHRGLFRT